MANLVKIFEVTLYVGYTANGKKCYDFIKYLKDNKIPHALLNYGDQFDHHEITFNALSSWSFGDPVTKVNFTDFPILIWKEGFDNYKQTLEYCTDFKKLPETNVVKLKELIDLS